QPFNHPARQVKPRLMPQYAASQPGCPRELESSTDPDQSGASRHLGLDEAGAARIASSRATRAAATTPRTLSRVRRRHASVRQGRDRPGNRGLADQRASPARAIGGRFGPEVITWLSDDRHPVLITQDLSSAYWPAATGTTHWRAGDIDAVEARLA